MFSRSSAASRISSALALLGLAAWAWLTIGLWQGAVSVPRVGVVYPLLVYAVPALAVAAFVLGPRPAPPWLGTLTGGVCVIAGAIVGSAIAISGPLVVAAVVALLLSAVLSRRWPAGYMIVMFGISGSYGTITAYTPVSPGQTIDLMLSGLWLGLLIGLATQRREHTFVLTPGIVLVALFLLASAVAVVFAPSPYLGVRAFRAAHWHMFAVLVLAYGGWRHATRRRVAYAIVVVSALVGAYATLRWAIGPASKEQALVAKAGDPLYNQVGGARKVQGSLPSGHQLGTWSAIAIPFCIAAAITWRNWARFVAAAAVPLLTIGLLGSSNRAALAGAVGGSIVVLVLNQLARAFRGPRLGIALAAVLSLGVAGFALFPVVVDNPAKVERYKNILTPSRDKSFQERVFKWHNAMADIDNHPFGRGLGTGGADYGAERFKSNAAGNVDNAYVEIAYEQGFAMMVFFIITLLILLGGLARRAVWTREPEFASLAIGASGALAAFMVTLLAGQYFHAQLAVGLWVIVGLALAPFTTRRPDEVGVGEPA
jgi:hypothetical protein